MKVKCHTFDVMSILFLGLIILLLCMFYILYAIYSPICLKSLYLEVSNKFLSIYKINCTKNSMILAAVIYEFEIFLFSLLLQDRNYHYDHVQYSVVLLW